jgi:hypothetical protein
VVRLSEVGMQYSRSDSGSKTIFIDSESIFTQ